MYFFYTDEDNVNNNELEELGAVVLKPINMLMMTSEISSKPPKIGKELTQWSLLPLGPTIIYTAKDIRC